MTRKQPSCDGDKLTTRASTGTFCGQDYGASKSARVGVRVVMGWMTMREDNAPDELGGSKGCWESSVMLNGMLKQHYTWDPDYKDRCLAVFVGFEEVG